MQLGVSACSPSVYVCLPVRKTGKGAMRKPPGQQLRSYARVPYLYPFPDGPPEVPPYHFFCVLELKKLGKTFGAKKIMSTFAPVSEILLLTDTERAHMSGGIREIWANTRVAKWGRL